jgi:O-antigen/teichoic acid export membrane protein
MASLYKVLRFYMGFAHQGTDPCAGGNSGRANGFSIQRGLDKISQTSDMAASFISYLRQLFYKGSFAANVLTVSSGILIGHLLTLASSPILTRLYEPSDLGLLGVYLSLLSIFGPLTNLRYVNAIPLPKDDLTAANLAMLCLLLTMVVTIIVGLMTWFFAGRLLNLIHAPSLIPYIWIMPLGILIIGIYGVLNFWGVRHKAFNDIAITKVTKTISRAVTQIGLGSLGMGPLGLLIGDTVGQGSGCTRLALLAWRQDKSTFYQISPQGVLEALRRYKKFPLFSMSTLLTVSANEVPLLLLSWHYGLAVLGWFALAQWVIYTPCNLISSSLSQVYQAEMAILAKKSPAKLARLYFKSFKTLSLGALIYVPMMVFVVPWLIPIIFGPKWQQAAVFIQILSIMYGLMLVSHPLLVILDVLERQELGLAREIIRAALMVGAIPLAAALNQSATMAIVFYSIGGAIGYLFAFLATWHTTTSYVNKCQDSVDKVIR